MAFKTRTLRPRTVVRLIFTACLALGAVLGGVLWVWYSPSNGAPQAKTNQNQTPFTTGSAPAGASSDSASLREQAWDRIAQHLEQATALGDREADTALMPLEEFFRQRRQGCRPFAQVVLGLQGKWQFIHSKLPWGDDNEHRRYLCQQFETRIFSGEELRREVELATGNYVGTLQAIENELLIQVRADLEDLPASALPQCRTQVQFQREYERLLAAVARDLAAQLKSDLVREAGSMVGADVAGAIALRVASTVLARLGVSGGVLSVGAGSSWATLGIGLVAAIVVDLGIDWGMKALGNDPVGQIAQKVDATLVRVQTLLLEGDTQAQAAYARLRELERSDSDAAVRHEAKQAADRIERRGLGRGLRQELHEFNALRSQVRHEALRRMVFQPAGG